MLYVDVDYARERRIVEASAFLKLRAVEAFVVVVDDKFDYWIFGGGSLDAHNALFLSAPGASSHLFHHVERPFVAAEIRQIYHRVGIYDSHHAHPLEVKAFCHHLGADKNLGAAV